MSTLAAFDILRSLDREVWLVTAAAGNAQGGLIATFVSPASIVAAEPRVTLGLAKQHHTWGLVEESGAFVLHLLTETHLDWVWTFGLTSGRNRDKLASIAWRRGNSGAPILNGSLAWLECRVEAKLDTGDRTVYLARVTDAGSQQSAPPLTVSRLVALASAETRQAIQRQFASDSEIDARAIAAWRSAQPFGATPPVSL